MPTMHTYDYAVVRVVPRVERGEFVNVGVIVSCDATDSLAARIELDPARVLALDPAADIDAIRAALGAIDAVCAGSAGAGSLGQAIAARALSLAGGAAQHRHPDLAGAHRPDRGAGGGDRSPVRDDGRRAAARREPRR